MAKFNLPDILFILLAFGVYIIVLNVDQHFDNSGILYRHFWLPLIIAYFIGRMVSLYGQKKKTDAEI